MKKLSLKSNASGKGEVMTRAQLKKVMGGDPETTGPVDPTCRNWYIVSIYKIYSDVKFKSDAIQAANECVSERGQDNCGWCCDSCPDL